MTVAVCNKAGGVVNVRYSLSVVKAEMTTACYVVTAIVFVVTAVYSGTLAGKLYLTRSGPVWIISRCQLKAMFECEC